MTFLISYTTTKGDTQTSDLLSGQDSLYSRSKIKKPSGQILLEDRLRTAIILTANYILLSELQYPDFADIQSIPVEDYTPSQKLKAVTIKLTQLVYQNGSNLQLLLSMLLNSAISRKKGNNFIINSDLDNIDDQSIADLIQLVVLDNLGSTASLILN